MRLHAGHRLAAVLIATLATVGCTKAPNDSQLTEQIQSRLSHDSGLQDKSITVQTQNGVVTLSGTVDNDAQRTAASRYASDMQGVKQVVNDLQMGPPPAPPAQIAEVTPPPPPPAPEKPKASAKSPPAKPQKKHKDPSEWDTQNSNPPPDNSTDNQMASADAANNAAVAPTQPATPPPPPPPPPPKKITIPSSSTIAIRLIDGIDSETATQGQTFHATLDSPLAAEGDVAVPTGHKVEGHVVDVKSAGKFAGQSLLVLQLDRINADGNWYNLQTDQYKREGNSRGKNTAEKVGAGAAIGAIIGGIAGGGKGAGIGAAAGGGLGGGVQAASKGQQIKLPSETVLNFTLQSPLTVTQVQKGPDAGRPKLDTPQ